MNNIIKKTIEEVCGLRKHKKISNYCFCEARRFYIPEVMQDRAAYGYLLEAESLKANFGEGKDHEFSIISELCINCDLHAAEWGGSLCEEDYKYHGKTTHWPHSLRNL